MKRFLHILVLALPLPLYANCFMSSYRTTSINDGWGNNEKAPSDTLSAEHKEDTLKLNEDAIKHIQFDFVPSQMHKNTELKSSPINKPWMDFKADLSVPTNMIDSTKVRKPEKYIRMLPYSIWMLYGYDPVYDVLAFGCKKRLELMLNLDGDYVEEYGRNLIPNAGRYNPNRTIGGASVTIGNLDFIGFLYNNLNKHGRMLKHNRKHANAWKTYQKVAPTVLSEAYLAATDSSETDNQEDYSVAQPGLDHHLESVRLTEEKTPKYFEHPDYRLLQTTEQRSRFGTYYDPDLYAMPSHAGKQQTDTLKHTIDKGEENKKSSKKVSKKSKKKGHKKDDGVLEELPNSMEDLYKYIRTKQVEDSIQRREIFRQDKADQNVYELEQQLRKLKEKQN